MAIFGDYAKSVIGNQLKTDPVLASVSRDYKAIAIELNKSISKTPPEYTTVEKNLLDVLRFRLDKAQIEELKQVCIDKGYIQKEDVEPETIEVLTTKWEQLGFYPKEIEFAEIEPLVTKITIKEVITKEIDI